MSTFVSYAQNFEDVMLWRALQNVQDGFYVDVGAQHPLRDSVTRAFYERGWRGVNIDPVASWHGLLCVDRPLDTNLRAAIGSDTGVALFYEVADTGLSTMDAQLAAEHSANGLKVLVESVPVRTLDSVLAEYAKGPVHFLKVDVEGAEVQVLQGLTLAVHRPWIILVEATLPNSQVDVSAQWEHFLTDAGYECAYFDGLNRYYIAQEHLDLRKHFATPPNFFDKFVRHVDWERAEMARRLQEEVALLKEQQQALVTLEEKIEASEEKIQVLQLANGRLIEEQKLLVNQLQQLQNERHQLSDQLSDQGRLLALILSSRSWKITAPLRKLTVTLGVARKLDLSSGAAVETVSALGVPAEDRLLELASAYSPERMSIGVSEPAVTSAATSLRVDVVVDELRRMILPPREMPAPLRRLPGVSLISKPVLRIYERLFRKQALINARIIEVLELLKNARN
ncbi:MULTISPECIES: FkbM family methyltransferase [Xanthomonas]|uniref:FkbM family methyltransferase n=1 Tax=Xanthomonas TaxID=338 RepID=UPI00070F3766|nr:MULTISPECIES: FkbM family methyltransferase [Xanthomonas]MBO9749304.1 FkbM family methyltransferase [Xanthomonas phaseoli pv. dieffenbachiae]MBO9750576.1 FkbM family methyltransferase [Xanthomonas phaseoli pv. dieffenbachiae]MBO9879436.1 FkbM family methyltransferase [Xanthomonas sp. D-99]MBO9891259.1 FkbM family methyltransferase [Xanthomonas sp. D-36-1]OQP71349.1 hypothetical protein IB69_017760 [Xanthomonas citri]